MPFFPSEIYKYYWSLLLAFACLPLEESLVVLMKKIIALVVL